MSTYACRCPVLGWVPAHHQWVWRSMTWLLTRRHFVVLIIIRARNQACDPPSLCRRFFPSTKSQPGPRRLHIPITLRDRASIWRGSEHRTLTQPWKGLQHVRTRHHEMPGSWQRCLHNLHNLHARSAEHIEDFVGERLIGNLRDCAAPVANSPRLRLHCRYR
jgi:hypothetical protein